MNIENKCHDCGASPGELHQHGCDTERCPVCGGQAISGCHPNVSDSDRMPWSGEWPGVAECREYGLWCYWDEKNRRWVKCNNDYPGATEDLNSLVKVCQWSQTQKRWIKK